MVRGLELPREKNNHNKVYESEVDSTVTTLKGLLKRKYSLYTIFLRKVRVPRFGAHLVV